jgi:hypothetical protein
MSDEAVSKGTRNAKLFRVYAQHGTWHVATAEPPEGNVEYTFRAPLGTITTTVGSSGLRQFAGVDQDSAFVYARSICELCGAAVPILRGQTGWLHREWHERIEPGIWERLTQAEAEALEYEEDEDDKAEN